MAKYDAGYLSPIRNKLGNAVGRTWRGIPVLAVYKSNPKNPRTDAQQIQRALLAAASSFARSNAAALNLGMDVFCKGKPQFPRSMFVKLNMKNFHASTPDSVTLEYANFVVSRGNVYNVAPGAPIFDETPFQCAVPYDASAIQALPGYAAGDMKVYLAAYAVDAKQGILSAGASIPVSGGVDATISFPQYWNGMKVHVWCFVIAQNAKFESLGFSEGEASDSIYVGNGNVQ